MRPILCGKGGVRLRDLIQTGKTLILDCKGMGKEAMIFTGAVVAQMVIMYMRFDEPDEYPPCAIYIDECQNFIGSNFLETALREGRKYNLSVLLATQVFSGMKDDLKHVMLSCGTHVVFQSPFRESVLFAKEMDIQPQDIQFLRKWTVAFKTPEKRGFIKVPSPPYVPKIKIQVAPQPKSSKWFKLKSYQPPDPQ